MSRVSRLFTWRSVLNDAPDLKVTEYAVGMAISTHMNEAGDGAWPSVRTIAREAKVAESTVRVALNGLEEKGYLAIERGSGRRHTNRYRALDPQRTHREPEPFAAGGSAPRNGRRAAQEPAAAPSRSASDGGRPDPETHREPEGLVVVEPSGSREETLRLTDGNPPAVGPEVVRTTSRTTPSVSEVASLPQRRRAADDSGSAQQLTAFYVDEHRRLGVEPPRRQCALAAGTIRNLLEEGQPGELIAAGIRIVANKGLDPRTLPSAIVEAQRAGRARRRRGRNGVTAEALLSTDIDTLLGEALA